MNVKTVGLLAALALVTTGVHAKSNYGVHSSGYISSKVKVSCSVSKKSYNTYVHKDSKYQDYKPKKRYTKYYGSKKSYEYRDKDYKNNKHVVQRCDKYWG
ncbi:hypothetical protein [Photobacterium sp. TY1-4]|uniref:hypothetical protein n=1 Tax=Photobacterium sp. TY1-4 TaxID=2899122 RepID=UPI0021C1F95F|nr:hypothetical protein [Photobacterium sp. TY1-4]UXI03909.1 hypothetical protein NH461_17455 [Photobacterium sp. TY1-4]